MFKSIFKLSFKSTLMAILLLVISTIYSIDTTGKNKFKTHDNNFLLLIGELISKRGVAEKLADRNTNYTNFAESYVTRIHEDQRAAISSPLGSACVHMFEQLSKLAEADKTPAAPIFNYAKNFFQRLTQFDTEIATLTEKIATLTDEKEQTPYRDTIKLLIRDKNQLREQHPKVNHLVTYISTFEAVSKDGSRIIKPDPKKFLDFMDTLEHKLQADALANIGKIDA
ncbi:MAG TPA: hypothetical protein VJJ81_00440 [Candidatus Babeliales bacterium]|nr:hypothetical protein [Candidatus Babeliales bacterium]